MSAETLKWMLYYDRQEAMNRRADAAFQLHMLDHVTTAVGRVTAIQRVEELLIKHANKEPHP